LGFFVWALCHTIPSGPGWEPFTFGRDEMTDEQVKIIAEAIKASGSEISESINKMSYDICEIKYSIHSLVESSRNTYTSTEDLGSINSTLQKLASSFKESTKIGGALWTGHR